jgi:hypothetical protein
MLLGGTVRMQIPEQFKDYDCRDYFDSDKFARGVYDEQARFWTFYIATDVIERPELEFLAVGSPGCDGLEWGYRKGSPGLWVFYPIEQRFQLLAPTLAELFEG